MPIPSLDEEGRGLKIRWKMQHNASRGHSYFIK